MPVLGALAGDVKLSMNEEAKKSGLSREQILDRMNALASRHGVRLSKGNGPLSLETFEKWLNPADAQRAPSWAGLVVFCQVLGTGRPVAVLAGYVGGRMIDEDDVTLLAWAKEFHAAKAARRRMRKLEESIG